MTAQIRQLPVQLRQMPAGQNGQMPGGQPLRNGQTAARPDPRPAEASMPMPRFANGGAGGAGFAADNPFAR